MTSAMRVCFGAKNVRRSFWVSRFSDERLFVISVFCVGLLVVFAVVPKEV